MPDSFDGKYRLYLSYGTQDISIGFVQNLSILDYYGEGNHSQNTLEEPEIHTSYLWLTAKTVPYSTSITFVAEPNTSGKSRTLYVYGAIRNGHTNIKVIQE